jgi:hypothetical protein
MDDRIVDLRSDTTTRPPTTVRLVVHRHIDDDDIDFADSVISDVGTNLSTGAS